MQQIRITSRTRSLVLVLPNGTITNLTARMAKESLDSYWRQHGALRMDWEVRLKIGGKLIVGIVGADALCNTDPALVSVLLDEVILWQALDVFVTD